MYDELIKRLRTSCESCKLWDGYKCCLKGECSAQTRLQAADAIEELRAAVEGYEANTNMVFDRSGNNTVVKFEPKWIPVTERLPECDLGAEVGNIEWLSCGMVHAGCFGRGGKYRDAYFRTWTDAGEGMDAKDADYWRAVTLPEPPKE